MIRVLSLISLNLYPYISRITDFTFLGNNRLATYSALDRHLVVTDLKTGAIIHSQKGSHAHVVIEGLTSS